MELNFTQSNDESEWNQLIHAPDWAGQIIAQNFPLTSCRLPFPLTLSRHIANTYSIYMCAVLLCEWGEQRKPSEKWMTLWRADSRLCRGLYEAREKRRKRGVGEIVLFRLFCVSEETRPTKPTLLDRIFISPLGNCLGWLLTVAEFRAISNLFRQLFSHLVN